jgi:type I restriction enzyme S subunit
MPQNWKTYKLGEVAEICSSKRIFRSDYVDEGVLFYRSKEIIEKANGISNNNDRLYISPKKFNEIKKRFGVPKKGDLLISAVGNRSGIPYVVKDEEEFYFKDGNLIWFKNIKKELNTSYIYHWIRSFIGQDTLQSIMIGSAQKALTIEGLRNLNLTLPPPEVQRRIASILGALDDKIELNLEMNKTLEEMAMALYKHWFVDFGPFRHPPSPPPGGNAEVEGGSDSLLEQGRDKKSLLEEGARRAGGVTSPQYGPDKFVDSELGMIPEGWEVKRLKDFGTVITPGEHRIQKTVSFGMETFLGYHLVKPEIVTL